MKRLILILLAALCAFRAGALSDSKLSLALDRKYKAAGLDRAKVSQRARLSDIATLLKNQGRFATEQSKIAAIPTNFTAEGAGDRRREGGVERMAASRYEGNRYTRDWLTDGQGGLSTLGNLSQRFETNPLFGAVGGFAVVRAAQAGL
jgi:hypothetical protein